MSGRGMAVMYGTPPSPGKKRSLPDDLFKPIWVPCKKCKRHIFPDQDCPFCFALNLAKKKSDKPPKGMNAPTIDVGENVRFTFPMGYE